MVPRRKDAHYFRVSVAPYWHIPRQQYKWWANSETARSHPRQNIPPTASGIAAMASKGSKKNSQRCKLLEVMIFSSKRSLTIDRLQFALQTQTKSCLRQTACCFKFTVGI